MEQFVTESTRNLTELSSIEATLNNYLLELLPVRLRHFLEIVMCIPQMTKWTINSRKHAKTENFSNDAKKVNTHPYGLIRLMSPKTAFRKSHYF